jgi:acetolactate synthase I/II/III large subunit
VIVASRVAQTLAAAGVERAYGLPGEDHLTRLDALAEAGIEYHTAYNESSAVIMTGTGA